ncbi:MAG: hypothetical protein LKF52_02100 [Butyrivibrio sp.]|jgi:Gpi18-like mannosyltransferase|nr:hypothetical protein [Butyrivibrio sp.]
MGQEEAEKRELIIDKWIHHLTERQLQMIGLAALVLLSVLIRIHMAPFCKISPDYNTFFATWVEQYRQLGIRKGLSQTIGDYYVPNNIIYALISKAPWEPWVLIAAVSCSFEYITAWYLYRLMVFLQVGKTKGIPLQMKAAYASVMVLFLPCAMWNSALWKQCDSIYTCFAVIALYNLLQEKYRPAVIWLGVSLSFKLQAVLLLPLFLCIYLMKKNFSVIHFVWLPLMYLLAGLPAILLHRDAKVTYLTYFAQMQEGVSQSYGLSSYFPNIYSMGLSQNYGELAKPAVMLTVALLGVMMIYVHHYRKNMVPSGIMNIGIMSIWTCCMFLPCMHERYDYMMLLMLAVYAAVIDRRMAVPAILANLCSMLTYTIVLFHVETLSLTVISALYITAYCLAAYVTVLTIRKPIEKENRRL